MILENKFSGTRVRQERHSLQSAKFKGAPKNSVIKINNILVQYVQKSKYKNIDDWIINKEHEARSEKCNIGVGRVKKGSGLRSAQRGIDDGSKQGLGFERLTRSHNNNKFWQFMSRCVCYNNILIFAILSFIQFINTAGETEKMG